MSSFSRFLSSALEHRYWVFGLAAAYYVYSKLAPLRRLQHESDPRGAMRRPLNVNLFPAFLKNAQVGADFYVDVDFCDF